jgi:hypothetical protein
MFFKVAIVTVAFKLLPRGNARVKPGGIRAWKRVLAPGKTTRKQAIPEKPPSRIRLISMA